MLLICACLFLMIPGGVFAAESNTQTPAATAKKVRMCYKTMEFYVGGTYTLKLENAGAGKITWKS